MTTITLPRAVVQQALDALDNSVPSHGGVGWLKKHHAAKRGLADALEQPQPAAQAEPAAWAGKAMELATDFAVESLRVGSSERNDNFMSSGVASWKTVALREKRESARERLRQYLYTTPIPAQPDHAALLREATAKHGHCQSCGALHPQHHSGCAALGGAA